jgi:chaperonin cofactor prefoldin
MNLAEKIDALKARIAQLDQKKADAERKLADLQKASAGADAQAP